VSSLIRAASSQNLIKPHDNRLWENYRIIKDGVGKSLVGRSGCAQHGDAGGGLVLLCREKLLFDRKA